MAAASTNLLATTRELWEKTVHDEVHMKMILPRVLIEENQVAFKAGTAYKVTVDKAEIDDLAQEYDDNDILTSGTKTVMTTAEWKRKRIQLPVVITGSEALDNGEGGDGQLIPLEERIVRKAHAGMRIKFLKMLYEAGSSTNDADKGFQGLDDALTHDLTYGGLSRGTTATNWWWQGASLANTFADYATAVSPSLSTFRSCIDAVSQFAESSADLIAITSNENFRALQSQVQQAYNIVKEGAHRQFGFTSMDIDGVEVVAEPWLSSASNSAASTTKKYFFLLNKKTWKLALSRKRKFGQLMPFKWQGENEGGRDRYLARAVIAGNLFCVKPNGNLFLSNMS